MPTEIHWESLRNANKLLLCVLDTNVKMKVYPQKCHSIISVLHTLGRSLPSHHFLAIDSASSNPLTALSADLPIYSRLWLTQSNALLRSQKSTTLYYMVSKVQFTQNPDQQFTKIACLSCAVQTIQNIGSSWMVGGTIALDTSSDLSLQHLKLQNYISD